jgi:hypothetical protein
MQLDRLERVLVGCFVVIAIAFVGGTVAGFQPSGWAWLLILALTGPTAAMLRIPPSAWRPIRWYLLFLIFATASLIWTTAFEEGLPTLVQLTVPLGAYLIAYATANSARLLPALHVTSLVLLAVAIVLVLLREFQLLPPDLVSTRPLAIAMAPLTVVALAPLRSVRLVLVLGGVVTAAAMISGSRMASLVLVLIVVTSPALALDWRKRTAVLVVCAAGIGGITQTDAFQERFFHDGQGSIQDIVTFSDRVNTAGRGELWPRLLEDCGRSPVIGYGIGASFELSSHHSNGAMPQPHNELLRTYCDTGLIGSVLFFAFIGAATLRSWMAFFRRPHQRIHAVAGQLLLVFIVFAATDNPMVYTAHFMVPMFLLLGSSTSVRLLPARRTSEEHLPTSGPGGRGTRLHRAVQTR